LPPAVTVHLVLGVEAAALDEAFRETQSHGSVIGPFTGLQIKWTAAVDNLITGCPDNIAHLAGDPDFRFIRQDVSEFMFVPGRVDYVFHFASPASPIDYLELPIPTLKVGALGTHNALGLAKEKNAVFVLASTSECYGDPLVHPQSEDYWGNVNPIGPRGVYDEAKRFAEAMTMAYHRYHGLNTKIVRSLTPMDHVCVSMMVGSCRHLLARR
jgi:nucleoside-diphosphate-sugar epimerase